MEQSRSTYALNEYQVKLSKIGDRLLIEIEAESTGKSFSVELNNDMVIQITNEIFLDVASMYHGLEDALKKKCPDVSLSFDGKEMLTYKASLSLGRIKKDLQFSISLQKNIDQNMKKMNETMSSIENKMMVWMDNIEKRGFSCVKFNPEANLNEGNLMFNPCSKKAGYFSFSNGNKTIELTSDVSDETLEFSKHLPQSGQFRVSIMLENTTKYTYMGIILADHLGEEKWHSKSFYYLTLNGCINRNSPNFSTIRNKNSLKGFGKAGDILTMVADVDQGIVSFEVNGNEANSININLKKRTHFAYIGFASKGGKATRV